MDLLPLKNITFFYRNRKFSPGLPSLLLRIQQIPLFIIILNHKLSQQILWPVHHILEHRLRILNYIPTSQHLYMYNMVKNTYVIIALSD